MHKNALLTFLLSAALLLTLANAQAQTIRYVKAGSSGDGSSWANASGSLQGVIDASAPGNQVWVAAGTYKPTTTTDRTVSFAMKNGVAIYGGFAGTETNLSQRPAINPVVNQSSGTILSGDIGTVNDAGDNSYHVVNNGNLNSTAILNGVVITGGNGDQKGGGVYNRNSHSTLINCTIQNNQAVEGGGIYNEGSGPALVNCLLLKNTASTKGGGIYNVGGSNPTLVNCGLLNNTAPEKGGAIYNEYENRPLLTNCSLNYNAARDGGGIYTLMRTESQPPPVLTNCVVFNNGDPAFVTVFQPPFIPDPLDLESNGPAPIFSPVQANFCLFERLFSNYFSFNGSGNVTTTTSPFVSANSLELTPGSRALEGGSPASVAVATGPYSATSLPTTDGAGNPRVAGCRVDIGAIEAQNPPPPPTRLYVRAGADGTTGLSWTDAVGDLQSALNYDCVQNLTEIWVAGGTYTPGTARTSTFRIRNGLAIYGGFVGNETSLSQRPAINPMASQHSRSILSGDLLGNDNQNISNADAENSFHVVSGSNLSPATVLDGFYIRSGRAYGGQQNDNGGGLYLINSSPTLVNCTIQSNGGQTGGAIYNMAGSPTLTNCSLEYNFGNRGGALFNETGSSPKLTNCQIAYNSGGAAIYNKGNSNPALLNCSLLSNGIENDGSSPALINCSLQNSGINSSNNSNPVLTNCVVFGRGGNTFTNTNSTVTATYSLFENTATGYTTTGTGNITTGTSPFVSGNSIELSGCSSAIDRGSNAAYTAANGPATDLNGNGRIFPANGTIDMGAVEYREGAQKPNPTRLYVRAGATGANTGLNWTDAFTDLQAALNYTCSGNLTEIWVANGTYKPTRNGDRRISFAMRNGVAIYGGFAGTETSLSQRPAINPGAGRPSGTILSGDINSVNYADDNSYHVINNTNLNNTAVLDGFVITAGYASESGTDEAIGGGILNNGSSPTIVNCTLSDNRAGRAEVLYKSPLVSGRGGGIYNSGGSSPMLINCVIQNNTAQGGGGIYNEGSTTLVNCSLEGNKADVGPGWGGAIYQSGGSLKLVNCSLLNNSAQASAQSSRDGAGGAIYNYSGTARLTNCSLLNNSAADGQGGAVLNRFSGNSTLTNCVLWNNGGINTFATANEAPNVTLAYSVIDITARNYDIPAGTPNTATNTRPFESANSLKLAPTSSAIDQGSNAAYTAANGPATDLVGNPRIFPYNGRIDAGAVEFQPAPTNDPPPAITTIVPPTVQLGSGPAACRQVVSFTVVAQTLVIKGPDKYVVTRSNGSTVGPMVVNANNITRPGTYTVIAFGNPGRAPATTTFVISGTPCAPGTFAAPAPVLPASIGRQARIAAITLSLSPNQPAYATGQLLRATVAGGVAGTLYSLELYDGDPASGTNITNAVSNRSTSDGGGGNAIIWGANNSEYLEFLFDPAATGTGRVFQLRGLDLTTGQSTANVVNSAPFAIQSPLPVTLRYFNGRMTDQGAVLAWQTAREDNNAFFQIERSRDARSFESIGTINSQSADGYSLSPLTYSHLDAQPLPGVNYYRLMQTDRDGTRTQAGNIVALSRENSPTVLFPNPLPPSGEASIEPPIAYTGYRITDVLGRIVQQTDAPGVLSRVSLAGLPAGVYLLRVETADGGVQTFRLLR